MSTKSRLLIVRDRFGVTCWNIGDTRRPPAGGRLAPHPHEARPRAAAPLALTVDQIRQETQLLLRCLKQTSQLFNSTLQTEFTTMGGERTWSNLLYIFHTTKPITFESFL